MTPTTPQNNNNNKKDHPKTVMFHAQKQSGVGLLQCVATSVVDDQLTPVGHRHSQVMTECLSQ